MSNSFTISVEFSFKGETFDYSASVNLDDFMARGSALPPLHDLIARANRIDPYSYQYEVLFSEELLFSDVEGFAADFIHDGHFDAEGFAARWNENRSENIVAAIAQRELGIADLVAEPALLRALRAAYEAGQSAPAKGAE